MMILFLQWCLPWLRKIQGPANTAYNLHYTYLCIYISYQILLALGRSRTSNSLFNGFLLAMYMRYDSRQQQCSVYIFNSTSNLLTDLSSNFLHLIHIMTNSLTPHIHLMANLIGLSSFPSILLLIA